MSLIEEFEHLRKSYEEIEKATKNFTTKIGRGGYGQVYEGHLSLSGVGTIKVAVKKFDTTIGGGRKEFLTEIQLLSRYKHENIVSLVGFCEEPDHEKFLIYVHAEKGSLDQHLKPGCPLTWKERINICVDSARGLYHLHNHVVNDEIVFHRDIKSGNILLDHNWKAMIADFGLSKIGRATENSRGIITYPTGTPGYWDPAYIDTSMLIKEADIYSFGIVLVEILCGGLCNTLVNSEESFAKWAQRHYKEKKLNLIIDDSLKNKMHSYSFNYFADIAFQCLEDDPKKRPSMGVVLQNLEESLELLEVEETHGSYDDWKLRKVVEELEKKVGKSRIDYEVIKAIYYLKDSPLSYITREEIYSRLSSGILVDEEKVWFSIDEDGKTREMISAIKFGPYDGPESQPESRFPLVAKVHLPNYNMRVTVRTRFLTSNVKYAAYLVCKLDSYPTREQYDDYYLSYRSTDKSEYRITYGSKIEENGWWMFELFQTANYKTSVACNVMLRMLELPRVDWCDLLIEGIMFLPLQKLEDDDEIERSESEHLSTSNIDWEKRLPSDYKKFINRSNKDMYRAYSTLSSGVLIKHKHEVNMWFWITKFSAKKCFLLPPISLFYDKREVKVTRTPSTESRE